MFASPNGRNYGSTTFSWQSVCVCVSTPAALIVLVCVCVCVCARAPVIHFFTLVFPDGCAKSIPFAALNPMFGEKELRF